MGGPNLEVVKFGFYMFFPIYIMYRYGDPEWYAIHVQPYKDKIWPPYEETGKPAKNTADLHAQLAQLRAERLAKKSGGVVQSQTISELQSTSQQEQQQPNRESRSTSTNTSINDSVTVGSSSTDTDISGTTGSSGWSSWINRSDRRLV